MFINYIFFTETALDVFDIIYYFCFIGFHYYLHNFSFFPYLRISLLFLTYQDRHLYHGFNNFIFLIWRHLNKNNLWYLKLLKFPLKTTLTVSHNLNRLCVHFHSISKYFLISLWFCNLKLLLQEFPSWCSGKESN